MTYDPIRDGPQGAPSLPNPIYPPRSWRFIWPKPGAKNIAVSGPDIDLSVDYDDVNHESVFNALLKMINVLNSAKA